MALNIEFNGQSKRVRVTPGTTMFQVVEDARAQFQLADTREYQLLHRKRPVDLSIPFRLTGVSNNATLELQALSSSGSARDAAPQQVRVCVQLADGKRVQSTFGSDATIATILTSFALLPAPQQFALSFLQREIVANAFESTTLRELGIMSGSAIFRVQAPPLSTPALSSQPALPAGSVSAPTSTTSAHSSAALTTPETSLVAPTCAAPKTSAVTAAAPVVTSSDDDVAMVDAAAAVTRAPLSSYDALQLLRDSCFDAAARTAVLTLLKIVTNILSHPDNEKMRSIRMANAAFERAVGRVRGGVEFLESIGFALDRESQCLVLRSDDEAAHTRLEAALELLHAEADELRIEAAARPQVVTPAAPDPTFDVYAPQIHRMQAQPRGPSVTEVLVDTLKSKQEQLLSHDAAPPPRNTVVTLPGRASAAPATAAGMSDRDADVAMSEDHPSDSRIVISMLKAKRAELEKAQNFRTQAMRELDELKRKKVFQTTLLRVQFPDRVVLQATFHPNETVQTVLDHVAQCLTSAAARLAFTLYVTPPMQTLHANKTLAELQLVPAALTYLSWTHVPPQALTELAPAGFYLRDDLVADDFAESKSSEDVPVAVAYPTPIALEPQPVKTVKGESNDTSAASTSASAAPKPAGKKPAWLKLSR